MLRRQVTTNFRQTEAYCKRRIREQEKLGSSCLPQPHIQHSKSRIDNEGKPR